MPVPNAHGHRQVILVMAARAKSFTTGSIGSGIPTLAGEGPRIAFTFGWLGQSRPQPMPYFTAADTLGWSNVCSGMEP